METQATLLENGDSGKQHYLSSKEIEEMFSGNTTTNSQPDGPLYVVESIIEDYKIHNEKNGLQTVYMPWFYVGRKESPLIPYKDLIEGYNKDDKDARCAESAVRELFSNVEAAALAGYLSTYENIHTIVRKAYPRPQNRILGHGGVGYGDNWILHEEPNYPLSFKVEGGFPYTVVEVEKESPCEEFEGDICDECYNKSLRLVKEDDDEEFLTF